mmetsp:Transcript_28697/g.62864  ORF Transcript_28697/g.62864 Transcript_28697/m.62864 type:complete len:228 (+) Transcript_28697:287-970(+)
MRSVTYAALGVVLGVDLDVVVAQIAAPRKSAARAVTHLREDLDSAVHLARVCHVLGRHGGVKRQRLPRLEQRDVAQGDVQVVLAPALHAAVADGGGDAAPVGVAAEDGRLDEAAGHHALRHHLRVLRARRARHLALDEHGGALAVPRDALGQRLQGDSDGIEQRLGLHAVRVADDGVPRRAIGQPDDAVVGGGVAVHRNLVEALDGGGRDDLTPKLRLHRGVAREHS